MVWEPIDILWHYEMYSLVSTFDITDLEDLSVVAKHIWCHLERRHIDYVYIWVFCGKNTTDLCIFALQKLVHGDSLSFFDR